MHMLMTTETTDDFYVFDCPHCSCSIAVKPNELNCKIFRCGVYKTNGDAISPHSPKSVCDALVTSELIQGCGKPFTFDGKIAKICDYV